MTCARCSKEIAKAQLSCMICDAALCGDCGSASACAEHEEEAKRLEEKAANAASEARRRVTEKLRQLRRKLN